MADLSTITDYIVKKAEEEAENIIKNADEKFDALMKQAATSAQDEYNKIINDAQLEAARILSVAQSKADKKLAQNVLKLKIRSIDEIIEKAKQKIYDMGDDAYNLFIEKLITKYAEEFKSEGSLKDKIADKLNPSNKGQIIFNERDRERIKLSSEIMKKYNLSLCDETEDLDGGFIIRYGKIEQNCSISAIFRDKYENLTDYISSVLF